MTPALPLELRLLPAIQNDGTDDIGAANAPL